MAKWIEILIYVGVILLGLLLNCDTRTPDEKWEDGLKRLRPHSHHPRCRRYDENEAYQEYCRGILNSLQEMRATAGKRISQGSLTEKMVMGFISNIPDRTIDDVQRLGNNEIYAFSEAFVEELKTIH